MIYLKRILKVLLFPFCLIIGLEIIISIPIWPIIYIIIGKPLFDHNYRPITDTFGAYLYDKIDKL